MRKSVLPKIPATLEQRVSYFVREQRLIPREQKLVVAVSGGPDSVCLLHVLVKLQKELDIKLHVAHLNHQLRGAESEADARYVADLAHRLDIPASIERRDVKAYQAQHRVSLEEAAREVRYTFLAQVAESVGAERAAVGHTIDDHVETILMHLIRGSGTRGLKGLQPLSRWQPSGVSLAVIRPLLWLSREETADYCRSHQLSPCLDASNLSLSSLRNRIRHQLLPQLQSYNP
ncbi:MAG: tRNA lysidine(34) synthetase TilS, partial [Dehalococcoidales bacterium]|nr:tRNA lysidine(34) synthetase TilS [Dehalococcoidales bacterium]